jgi:hypothetical protein
MNTIKERSNMEPYELQQPSFQEKSLFNSMNSVATPRVFKHSGPGIASFVLSMLSLLGYIASVALLGAIVSPSFNVESLNSPSKELIQILGSVVLLLLLFVILNVIGLILGIVGSVLKNRRKLFSVLGLIINGVILLCIASFFIYAVVNATT